MAYETYYVDSGKGMHKVGIGIVTSAEILASAVEQSSNEERSRKLKYALVDFSGTTDLNMTPEGVRQLVELNRKLASYAPGTAVAIVAPGELTFALSRLWQTFSADLGWKANVFHGRSDAVAWLRKQLGRDASPAEVDEQYPFLRQDG